MSPTCRERCAKFSGRRSASWNTCWAGIAATGSGTEAMKVLLAIPHVFAPKEGSLYSSQTEAKRSLKQEALLKATIGNLNRHRQKHWIHASLGKNQQVVNRELSSPEWRGTDDSAVHASWRQPGGCSTRGSRPGKGGSRCERLHPGTAGGLTPPS